MLDLIASLAGVCILTAFYCTNLRMIRLLSMAASALFIVYAVALGLIPVVILHGLLLPLNAWRLLQSRQNT